MPRFEQKVTSIRTEKSVNLEFENLSLKFENLEFENLEFENLIFGRIGKQELSCC